MMSPDAQQVLRDNHYTLTVRASGPGLLIEPPAMPGQPGRHASLVPQRGPGVSGLVVNSSADPEESFLPVAGYAIVPAIAAIVRRMAREFGLDGEATVYLGEDGTQYDSLGGLMADLEGPFVEEDEELRGALERLLERARGSETAAAHGAAAADLGVLESYRLCVQLQAKGQ